MRFIGGFLRFLGVLLMLIGASLATICCYFGREDNDPGLYGVAVVVFLCFLFVALGVLGTGMALGEIAKLKKRVAQLEQRLWDAVFTAPVIPAAASNQVSCSQMPVMPEAEESAEPVATQQVLPEAVVPERKKQKNLLTILLVSAVVVLLAVLIAVVAGNIGRSTDAADVSSDMPMETMAPVENEDVVTEEQESASAYANVEVSECSMGTVFGTDFVDFCFDELMIEKDIQKTVTIDNVSNITGPQPLEGQQYVCLSGTIVNTSKQPLPVYDFFLGQFDLDGYLYEVSANDCDILSEDGSPVNNIDPLMEYEIRIFTAIPDALAEKCASGDGSFTFGFYDGFDNYELSYNRSFEKEPIGMCPYQFMIPFE